MKRVLIALGTPIPIYVTRKSADGTIGTWSIAAWYGLFVTIVVMANSILWGIYGIIEAARLLF